MLAKLKFFMPGESTRMILIAAFIGLLAGGAIIVFREAVELVHEIISCQSKGEVYLFGGVKSNVQPREGAGECGVQFLVYARIRVAEGLQKVLGSPHGAARQSGCQQLLAPLRR